MFSEIYCPIVKSQLPSEWNHETIRPSSVVPQSAPRQCFVEIQFDHIIAFGKGCVLLVSDFLLLQPKLLLRPKLDINGGSYIGATKTEIDSTRKETHLLKGQLRQRVILVEKRGKDNQLQSLALRLDKNQHWLQLHLKKFTRNIKSSSEVWQSIHLCWVALSEMFIFPFGCFVSNSLMFIFHLVELSNMFTFPSGCIVKFYIFPLS